MESQVGGLRLLLFRTRRSELAVRSRNKEGSYLATGIGPPVGRCGRGWPVRLGDSTGPEKPAGTARDKASQSGSHRGTPPVGKQTARPWKNAKRRFPGRPEIARPGATLWSNLKAFPQQVPACSCPRREASTTPRVPSSRVPKWGITAERGVPPFGESALEKQCFSFLVTAARGELLSEEVFPIMKEGVVFHSGGTGGYPGGLI